MPDITLPPNFCALDVGTAVDNQDLAVVIEKLKQLHLGEMAEALGNYDEISSECTVEGCASFIKLSKQAGAVVLSEHGSIDNACFRPDS